MSIVDVLAFEFDSKTLWRMAVYLFSVKKVFCFQCVPCATCKMSTRHKNEGCAECVNALMGLKMLSDAKPDCNINTKMPAEKEDRQLRIRVPVLRHEFNALSYIPDDRHSLARAKQESEHCVAKILSSARGHPLKSETNFERTNLFCC